MPSVKALAAALWRRYRKALATNTGTTVALTLIAVAVVIGGISQAFGSKPKPAAASQAVRATPASTPPAPAQSSTAAPTRQATSSPAAPNASPSVPPEPPADPYPPKTFADIQNFYGMHQRTPYTQLSDEQVGSIAACEQRRVRITVPKADTDEQVAAAMVNAYVDDRVGSGAIFAYRDGDDTSSTYTAGRIERNAPCLSDSTNTLEIDVGDAASPQTYLITRGLPPGPGS